MRSGRPRRLLGPTVAAAVVLAISAFVVWGVALWFSWGAECPARASQTGGLGNGVQAWPPAVECTDQQGNAFWHEPLAWSPWVVGILIAVAAVILLTGLVVAIRDLRRPAPSTSPQPLTSLEARFAPGGHPGHPPQARRSAAGTERDPPAMAA